MNNSLPEFWTVDYQAALSRLQRSEEWLLLSGVGGTLIAAGGAAYALGRRAALPLGLAWAAPLPFLALAALLLTLFAWRLAARADWLALRQQAGLPVPPPSPHAPLLRALLALPAAALAALYGLTLLFGLRAVYSASRAAGTSYGVLFAVAGAALALGGLAVWRQWRGQPALTLGEVRRAVLPDPRDFLLGMLLFGGGFAAAWLTTGLNSAQLPVINALFRRNLDFTNPVPLAAVLALGLTYFAVIEGLLLPGLRLWREPDGASTMYIYTQFFVRLGLALALSFALGGAALLVLALLLTLQQALRSGPHGLRSAETDCAHPPSAARARFLLLWGGLLPPLRFFAGALAWVGPAWTFSVLLLLACAVAFIGLGLRAGQRARQARLAQARGQAPAPYDLHSAPLWRRAAFLAAVLTALGLLALELLAESCAVSLLPVAGFGGCKGALLIYRQISPLNAFLLVFDLLLLGPLLCAALVRLLRRARLPWARWNLWARRVALAPPVALTVLLLAGGLLAALPSLVWGALLSGTLTLALWAER